MCQECAYANVLGRIEDLLDSGKCNWAQQTLEGIAEWVEENKHVTDGQREAVENIADRVQL